MISGPNTVDVEKEGLVSLVPFSCIVAPEVDSTGVVSGNAEPLGRAEVPMLPVGCDIAVVNGTCPDVTSVAPLATGVTSVEPLDCGTEPTTSNVSKNVAKSSAHPLALSQLKKDAFFHPIFDSLFYVSQRTSSISHLSFLINYGHTIYLYLHR